MTTITKTATDIWPTRYVAFDNPGEWAVFTPVEGKFRHCRADADPIAVSVFSSLTPSVRSAVCELAVLHLPETNEEYPHLTDGFYAEVQEWGAYPEHKRFVADCHYTAPVKARWQKGARLFAATRDEAMKLAEEWIARVRELGSEA